MIRSRLVLLAAGPLTVCLALLLPAQPSATGQDNSSAPKWEFKAVKFDSDEKESTKKLNDLAAQGWDYVGPLTHGLVAFKRRTSSLTDQPFVELGVWIGYSKGEDPKSVNEKERMCFIYMEEKQLKLKNYHGQIAEGKLIRAGGAGIVEITKGWPDIGLQGVIQKDGKQIDWPRGGVWVFKKNP